MLADVMDAFKDMLKIQSRVMLCVEKRLSKLAQVKSKVKETRRKKIPCRIEGKVQMRKIEENTHSGKGNVKP